MAERTTPAEDFLTRITAAKRDELERLRRQRPLEQLREAQLLPVRDFAGALKQSCAVMPIAEIKRRSPSKGALRPGLDPQATAVQFAAHGAAAISVLTEGSFFGGSADDLTTVRRSVDVPLLRKDFTIDPYQLYEARALGADAVLLIVRLLDGQQLGELLALSVELGLAALVEAHDANDIERALESGAKLVGINSRNLSSFQTDLSQTLALRRTIPADVVTVAESGIAGPDDVRRVLDAGFDAFLVGEYLMRSADPGQALTGLVEAARR